MTIVDRWLLPDGVEEILPPRAQQMECLRRQWLDLYRSWGYELVVPPMIEFVESLLAGMGNQDLDLQTFKLTDQLTGRLMGVRADMTPQVARIDAHGLKREGPVRLCYAGSVLHTKAASLSASRSPYQVGAELYGNKELESDIEIISLMLETLQCAGLPTPHIDIGHVGIYRELSRLANLSRVQEIELFEAMQCKAFDDIKLLVNAYVRDKKLKSYFIKLPTLTGGNNVLKSARKLFADLPMVIKAIDDVEKIVAQVKMRNPSAELYFDLSELRGYHYHSGLVFAAYLPGQGQAIAKGGRYDDIGELFGRARPATGFSVDMKQVINLLNAPAKNSNGILAPSNVDEKLWRVIQQLRATGECVVVMLPGQKITASALGCNRQLQYKKDEWVIVPA
jgi:ATP phosphoribosyltransferase regulatory subunit